MTFHVRTLYAYSVGGNKKNRQSAYLFVNAFSHTDVIESCGIDFPKIEKSSLRASS